MKIIKKLTKEQQQLATDNHNLIYYMMKKFNLSENDIEDWYGTCAIGLCNAALSYDVSQEYKFTTYACICIEHEIFKVWSANDRAKRKCEGVLSLNVIIPGTSIEVIDTIADSNADTYTETIEFMDCFHKAVNQLKNRDKDIILKLAENKTRKDIELEYGISRERVRQIVMKFNRFLEKELES